MVEVGNYELMDLVNWHYQLQNKEYID
jgi:hypothetical protein